jgi:hypothetical protein
LTVCSGAGLLFLCLCLLLFLFLATGEARAATTTLGPGGSLSLEQDLTLATGDSFDAEGTGESPCAIEGNGHSIVTAAGWEGTFILRYCALHGLGHVAQGENHSASAISIDTQGASMVLVEGNTFDASGGLVVNAQGDVPVQILSNTVLETSLVDVSMTVDDMAEAAMMLSGGSNTTLRLFQGNHVYRSRVKLDHVQNWLVGGDAPGQGNVFIGERAGIYVEQGSIVRIVGNYVHVTPEDINGWNELKPLSLDYVSSTIVEHNVIRDGNWLVSLRGAAEVRYNLLGDSHDRPWIIVAEDDSTRRIHHNVCIRNDPMFGADGVEVQHAAGGTTTTEIYNNTFAGGGSCWHKTGPAVVVPGGAFLASLRSNAFFDFVSKVVLDGVGDQTALVRGDDTEAKTPTAARLGYADYNLFHNPLASMQDNYAIAVAGKRERVDPGFALNDATAHGAMDEQVDPKFGGGMIPVQFPYSDEDIKAGTTTVCQILAFYRKLYTPAPGSPLIGAGDPADGANNNIGAIGGADDHFGTLCAGGDMGTPNLSPAVFTCPAGGGGTGTGGSSGMGTGGMAGMTMIPPGGKGFVCVCEAAAGPRAPSFGGMLLLVGAILRRRRSR